MGGGCAGITHDRSRRNISPRTPVMSGRSTSVICSFDLNAAIDGFVLKRVSINLRGILEKFPAFFVILDEDPSTSLWTHATIEACTSLLLRYLNFGASDLSPKKLVLEKSESTMTRR